MNNYEIGHLKPEEINLFLEFCDADSDSKSVFINPNRLTLMDFLYKKISSTITETMALATETTWGTESPIRTVASTK